MIPLFLKTLRHFITLQIVFEKHPAPQAIVPFAPISVCQSSVEGFVVFPANEPHDLPILRLRNKGEVAFFNQDLGIIPQQELVAMIYMGRKNPSYRHSPQAAASLSAYGRIVNTMIVLPVCESYFSYSETVATRMSTSRPLSRRVGETVLSARCGQIQIEHPLEVWKTPPGQSDGTGLPRWSLLPA